MQFILTNVTDNQQQSVTRECVDRVKGKSTMDSLVKKVQETGASVDTYFEGDYDLRIANE